MRSNPDKFSIQRQDELGCLTELQTRLWLNHEINPQRIDQNMHLGLALQGNVNIPALNHAVSQLLDRHQILKMVVKNHGGHPILKMAQPEVQVLRIYPMRKESEDEPLPATMEIVEQLKRTPFDLLSGPLFRLSLIEQTNDYNLLFIQSHHIVFDGMSKRIVLKELFHFYAAAESNKLTQLNELAFQFNDYAEWQKNTKNSDDIEGQHQFWNQKFSGDTPEVALFSDRQGHDRPKSGRQLSGRQLKEPAELFRNHNELTMPASLAKKIKIRADNEGVTEFEVLLGAFLILLHRYTAEQDLLVGTPFGNRPTEETKALIGPFVISLPVKVRIDPTDTIRDVLQLVRTTMSDAKSNPDIPSGLLARCLRSTERNSVGNLFPIVMRKLQRTERCMLMGTLHVDVIELGSNTIGTDFILDIQTEDKRCFSKITYDNNQYNQVHIEQFLHHYHRVLLLLTGSTSQTIASLSLLRRKERFSLLNRRNAVNKTIIENVCIHQLFEKQAALRPDSPALIQADLSVSYNELEVAANQLSHYLLGMDFRPGSAIAISIDRSATLVIAILAVLKAGGVVVVIDPVAPLRRNQSIVTRADCALLIKNGDTQITSDALNLRCVNLTALKKLLKQQPIDCVPCRTTATDPCLISFTSGSTGEPKGVLINHRSVVNYVEDFIARYNIDNQDTRLQFGSVGSEFLLSEVLIAISSGAKLVIPAPQTALSVTEFIHLLNQHAASYVSLPSAYWHELVNLLIQKKVSLPNSIKLVITGMDVMAPDVLCDWQKIVSDKVTMVNAYGPAETTFVSTCYRVDSSFSYRGTRVPIGQPISNVQVYILDTQKMLVPTGVVGEIYIGGVGVAMGYVNDKRATDDRFVPNMFSQREGEKLYRTGDCARYLLDGNIEFLGRLDRQIKIRGYRVEPSEVEAAFRSVPLVTDITVHSVASKTGEKELAAFVVCSELPDNAWSVLTGSLNALPHYMLPAKIFVVKHIPRNPSGKINTHALLSLNSADSQLLKPDSAEACTALDMTKGAFAIQRIWQELLNQPTVGANVNFFECGGHSLLAIKLCSRILSDLDAQLTIKDIFENPTIALQAELVNKHDNDQILL